MIGLTLFVGVVIANFNENKVKATYTDAASHFYYTMFRMFLPVFTLRGSNKNVLRLPPSGHCSPNSGPEEVGGSEESTENSPTPTPAPPSRCSDAHKQKHK